MTSVAKKSFCNTYHLYLFFFSIIGIIRQSIHREETGMLLEDLKQQLDDITGRLDVLRRHL